MSIKIGDKFYVKDKNRRKYEDGKIVYRNYFAEVEVSGETSRSWIITGWAKFKVPKNNPFGHQGGEFGLVNKLLTKADVENYCWENENRIQLVEKVRDCSIDLLREVDEIFKRDEAP